MHASIEGRAVHCLQAQERGASRAQLHNHDRVLACEYLGATQRAHRSKHVCALNAETRTLGIVSGPENLIGSSEIMCWMQRGQHDSNP